jgi:Dolichyl-phosphate-mannose-protein mannosyltransferase
MNPWGVPRFDGAGYAVLGQALTSGQGYREINQPGAPPHDHFPPGYPFALALLWWFTGRSTVGVHVFSMLCTIVAVLLGWRWFRTMYPPRTALLLGLALSINWTWGRIGGSIQSEPLFMAWELMAILAAIQATRDGAFGSGILLGIALAASVLTRHVGLCIGGAVVLDLGLRGQWKVLITSAATATVLVLPWAGWLLAVHHHTQLGLLTTHGLVNRIAEQALFYLQRIPDQITGPFVEVGTVFKRSPAIVVAANLWAALAGGIVIWGWVRSLQIARRRLAGLIGFITLLLLFAWPFTEAGRFLIPLLPMVLVGFTEGLAYIIGHVRIRAPRKWAVVILLGASVPYSAYSIINERAEAQHRIHLDFDAACQWLTVHATRPGPILTRHPGEVFWQTGHSTIEPDSADLVEIDRLIDRLGVTYLLVDDQRYANASVNPLREFVGQYPARVALVWRGSHGSVSVGVFEIVQSK